MNARYRARLFIRAFRTGVHTFGKRVTAAGQERNARTEGFCRFPIVKRRRRRTKRAFRKRARNRLFARAPANTCVTKPGENRFSTVRADGCRSKSTDVRGRRGKKRRVVKYERVSCRRTSNETLSRQRRRLDDFVVAENIRPVLNRVLFGRGSTISKTKHTAMFASDSHHPRVYCFYRRFARDGFRASWSKRNERK